MQSFLLIVLSTILKDFRHLGPGLEMPTLGLLSLTCGIYLPLFRNIYDMTKWPHTIKRIVTIVNKKAAFNVLFRADTKKIHVS